jgi:hypothetical protein
MMQVLPGMHKSKHQRNTQFLIKYVKSLKIGKCGTQILETELGGGMYSSVHIEYFLVTAFASCTSNQYQERSITLDGMEDKFLPQPFQELQKIQVIMNSNVTYILDVFNPL